MWTFTFSLHYSGTGSLYLGSWSKWTAGPGNAKLKHFDPINRIGSQLDED